MVDIQEHATKDVMHPVESADGATAAAEGASTEAVEETTGAVGAFVGMLTGGFVITAAAGFVVGIVVGVAVARGATPSPPPRWQVWR